MGDYIKGDLVQHEKFGIGRVEETEGFGEHQLCQVFFSRSDKSASIGAAQLRPLSEEASASYEMLKLALKEIREEELPQIEIMDRWKGGELLIKAAIPDLEPKKIPIDAFFHKIVMVRDRLRVLEQHINANKALSDDEKVQLQQYITRIYGSLTTFNILFKNKRDHFVGQKGEE